MAKHNRIRAPRGMPDALPDEMPLVRHMETTAHRVFGLYGYEEIRTPLFEETRLFVRGIGATSDIVEKEMYTFAEGDDSITLRPEATAPVVRAAVEHNLLKQKGFWKLYYVGPMFRKERPQAGRTRQFNQIGTEALGSAEPVVDAESVILAARYFEAIGLDGVRVKLNTIGCPECRANYREALKTFFEPHRKDLCEDCRSRFDRNVFRILDCKNPTCKEFALKGPIMRDHLDADCGAHFNEVTARLTDAGCGFDLDDHLVRGFDYYTRTVFELCHASLGARDAICGGGRYDNLVKELGGPKAGCVGFAVGVVPTLLALQKTGADKAAESSRIDVYIVAVNDKVRGECFTIAQNLREAGVSADLDCERRSLKAQMRSANRMGARHTVVVGPDELAEGCVKVKTMETGEEENVAIDQLAAHIAAAKNG